MPVFERTIHREPVESLDGQWQFRTDPDAIGVDEQWCESTESWDDARTVNVPHSWQEEHDLRRYDGIGWYRTTFSISETASDEPVWLRFGAVDYEATVWLNGVNIGRHQGGYLPFHLDITDALLSGENTVTVRVRDPGDLSEIPHGKQGEPWYTPVSGIWQSVDLIVVPETRVTAAYATPDLASDTVEFEIETTATPGTDFRTTVRIEDDGETIADEELDLTDDGTGTVVVSVDDPVYWHPETPYLYDFVVELRDNDTVIDTYADYFGMRSIEIDDGKLSLNGDHLFVRGALDQAYYPDTFYRPEDLDTYEYEIRVAKDLGFNLLRKHIKPAHPEFIRLADELGVLVWQEPANPSRFTDRSTRAVREQFERMVDRDHNSPSQVIWSLYNEEWGIGHGGDETERLWNDPEKQEYLAGLYEHAKAYDPTRLICDNSGWAHVATDINDYHEYFVVPDRKDAWRDRLAEITSDPSENYAVSEPAPTPESTPILVSEFGTWGLPDLSALREYYGGDPHWFDHEFLDGLKRPAGIDDRFAESHLSDTFENTSELSRAWQHRERQSVDASIRDMRTTDRISGYVITELTDIEWEFNGILDYLRDPKEGFTDAFADSNAPVAAWANPTSRVYWTDETLRADVVVVNDTAAMIETTVKWTAFAESGRVDVSVAAGSVERIEDAIQAAIPDVAGVQSEALSVELRGREQSTTTEVTVVPDRSHATSAVDVYVSDDTLAETIEERGFNRVASADTADISVVIEPTETTIDAVANGADVVVLPGWDGQMGDADFLSLTELPEEDSWNLCASLITQTLFDGVNTVPGSAFESLYPYAYVNDVGDTDAIDVGYAEGWVANVGGILLTRSIGEGTLTVCTLRVTDAYGRHPVATAIVEQLLKTTQ